MIDFFFALGQLLACVGLLYGMIVSIANWRESDAQQRNFDPIIACELPLSSTLSRSAIAPPVRAADRDVVETSRKAA